MRRILHFPAERKLLWMAEWRVFYSTEEVPYSIFDDDFFNKQGLHPEKRTDYYYTLPDERLGLKLRGGKNILELKIMKSKDEENIENWIKTISGRIANESQILPVRFTFQCRKSKGGICVGKACFYGSGII